MKNILLAIAFVAITAVSAAAQSTACNAGPLTGTVQVATPVFNFAACVPAAEQNDGIGLEVNGVTTYPSAVPETPNAAGKVAFPLSVTLTARGNYTIRTFPYTLKSDGTKQPGPLSVPFALAYEKVSPVTAPTNHPR